MKRFYLSIAAVAIDLCSQQIAGTAIVDHLRTELVESALDIALTECYPPRNLLHHSDRGSQYTSLDCQKQLTFSHITVSMSRVGNCRDNAPMKSFRATLKHEYEDIALASRSQTWVELFCYIASFYDRQRRHSTLDYISPCTFESQSERLSSLY